MIPRLVPMLGDTGPLEWVIYSVDKHGNRTGGTSRRETTVGKELISPVGSLGWPAVRPLLTAMDNRAIAENAEAALRVAARMDAFALEELHSVAKDQGEDIMMRRRAGDLEKTARGWPWKGKLIGLVVVAFFATTSAIGACLSGRRR